MSTPCLGTRQRRCMALVVNGNRCAQCRVIHQREIERGEKRKQYKAAVAPHYRAEAYKAAKARIRDQWVKCTYCDKRADTVDHVVPVKRGGTSEPNNLVPACRSCNSAKRDR